MNTNKYDVAVIDYNTAMSIQLLKQLSFLVKV